MQSSSEHGTLVFWPCATRSLYCLYPSKFCQYAEKHDGHGHWNSQKFSTGFVSSFPCCVNIGIIAVPRKLLGLAQQHSHLDNWCLNYLTDISLVHKSGNHMQNIMYFRGMGSVRTLCAMYGYAIIIVIIFFNKH